MIRHALLLLVLTLALAPFLGGCSAAPTTPEFEIGTGGYPAAFDAAREVLRGHRFQLERVDAAAGVITTQPKSTGGLATPWDDEQSSFGQNVDDLLNLQRRVVRITFSDARPGTEPESPIDPASSMRARVEVIIYRMQTPGLRPSSRAITLTSVTADPQAVAMGTGYSYEIPVSQDTQFAARLADEISKRSSLPVHR